MIHNMETPSTHKKCSKATDVSEGLLVDSKSLYYLKLYFYAVGISANKDQDPVWFKWLTLFVNVAVWACFVVSLEFMIFEYSTGGGVVLFYRIGLSVWTLQACIVYSFFSYCMLYGTNVLSFIRRLTATESNEFGREHACVDNETNSKLLECMCLVWIGAVLLISLSTFIASSLLFGPASLVSDMVPFSKSAGYVVLVFAFILSVAMPLQIVIVRIASYFTEKRLMQLINYVEKQETADISVCGLMGWYDDLYKLNSVLSCGVSPFVTLSIVLTLPRLVLTLQGLALHEISVREGSALMIWIAIDAFTILVITGNVAGLHALNRRFEIALGKIVSRDRFATAESYSAFDLALAKARAIPFGVCFMGTRARVSYGAMWTVSSVVVSMFLFVLGYS